MGTGPGMPGCSYTAASDTSSVTATSDDFIIVSVELSGFRMLLLLFYPSQIFITEGLILTFTSFCYMHIFHTQRLTFASI